MIVKKLWKTREKKSYITYMKSWRGWFLFGIIPIYIEQTGDWTE